MMDYKVGDKLYFVNSIDELVVATIEKIGEDYLWCKFDTPEGDILNMSVRREDNPWPVFPTPREAIEHALTEAIREVSDLLDEVAIAQVRKAAIESLYLDQIGLGPMLEFEDEGNTNV